MSRPGFGTFRIVCLFLICSTAMALRAADEAPTTAPDPGDAVSAPTLSASQEAIEMRYRRFENSLHQLSEYLRKTDPARAELLVRAIGKSKEGRIPEQLQSLTELLKKDQLGDAVERQETVVAELQTLLELLMSEARMDEIELEKRRFQDLIKDVNKLIGRETDARAETERGGDPANLQRMQKQIADATKKLVDKIASQDAAKKSGKNDKRSSESSEKPESNGEKDADSDKEKPADSTEPDSDDADKPSKESDQNGSGKSKSADGNKDSKKDSKKSEPNDKKPKSDEENAEKQQDEKSEKDASQSDDSEKDQDQQGKQQQGKQQQGKQQQGKPQQGKPQQGKPQEGQEQQESPQDGQQSDQPESSEQDQNAPQKQQDKTPGRDEIQRAKQEMDRAIQELKKNNKKKASDKQDKAIAELMKAKEKLEEILRQVREEEREMVLAQMEARFRDMLQKQEAIYHATLAVHAVPVESRTDRHRNRAVELARNEEQVSLLAAKALTLLKEEGSSVAFPEAVEQIRDDMLNIARRLDRADVGEITQNIEQDTIESLKELIESLQKELEKAKDKKQQSQREQQQQQRQQEQGRDGLVNKLAELKMLRSLQYRVNRRTKQLGRLVDGEQAVDADVVNQLKQLSDRQSKVQKATYDLATGKNQ